MEMKNEKGFTILELIVVLAIIAILGVIILPNFFDITDKAKLKSDVQSARVIQNALDLYKAETGSDFDASGTEGIVKKLTDANYLGANSKLEPQTEKAKWVIVDKRIYLDISPSYANKNIEQAYKSLSDYEKSFVKIS